MTCKFGTGGAHRLACSGGKRRKGTKHLHVRCTCTVHSSPLNRTAPSTLCQGLPTYRVWCLWLKISLHRRTPTSKKFSDPGACSLHPTGTATTKAHTLRLYTCDLQIWGRWGLPFGLQGWLKVCASLHAAARATCHVHRAPLKRTKSCVRRLGLSTLKIWCECTAPFSRQTPESSTDRQKGGREGGRQKMPTYPPSINLRNTKNLHLLKHMNFPLPSYDFGLDVRQLYVVGGGPKS